VLLVLLFSVRLLCVFKWLLCLCVWCVLCLCVVLNLLVCCLVFKCLGVFGLCVYCVCVCLFTDRCALFVGAL
jgi:hypothetical protein